MKTVVISTPNCYPYYREVRPLAVSRGLAITPLVTNGGVVPRRYVITHLNTGGSVVLREMTAPQARRMLAALVPMAHWRGLTLTDMTRINKRLKKNVGKAIQRVLLGIP